jgi:hypothetical protein
MRITLQPNSFRTALVRVSLFIFAWILLREKSAFFLGQDPWIGQPCQNIHPQIPLASDWEKQYQLFFLAFSAKLSAVGSGHQVRIELSGQHTQQTYSAVLFFLI